MGGCIDGFSSGFWHLKYYTDFLDRWTKGQHLKSPNTSTRDVSTILGLMMYCHFNRVLAFGSLDRSGLIESLLILHNYLIFIVKQLNIHKMSVNCFSDDISTICHKPKAFFIVIGSVITFYFYSLMSTLKPAGNSPNSKFKMICVQSPHLLFGKALVSPTCSLLY